MWNQMEELKMANKTRVHVTWDTGLDTKRGAQRADWCPEHRRNCIADCLAGSCWAREAVAIPIRHVGQAPGGGPRPRPARRNPDPSHRNHTTPKATPNHPSQALSHD